MDEKDQKIIQLLRENSKLTTQQLSRKTLIPITTIHNRIRKLEQEGVIKQYTIILDKKKVGKELTAYIETVVDYNYLKAHKMSQFDLAKRLRGYECVEAVALVTGETDIILKVAVKNIDELNEFGTEKLRNIGGIDKTRTMVVLKEV